MSGTTSTDLYHALAVALNVVGNDAIREDVMTACKAAGISLVKTDTRIEVLEKALRECGADYISPPCTVAQGYAYVAAEFRRRVAVANAALALTPWKQRVADERARLGRDPTLSELLVLARGYEMTEAEINEQRQSWTRQDMD